jgi:hypothetical protein
VQIIRKGAFESKPPNRTDRIPAGGPPHPNSPRENARAIAAGYDATSANREAWKARSPPKPVPARSPSACSQIYCMRRCVVIQFRIHLDLTESKGIHCGRLHVSSSRRRVCGCLPMPQACLVSKFRGRYEFVKGLSAAANNAFGS